MNYYRTSLSLSLRKNCRLITQ